MNNLHSLQATSPLSMWLDYLQHLHTQPIQLGLERIRYVAQQLELLNPVPLVFAVAGTNGKGTTCCTLETLLMAAGYRVGVYSSPHLLHYTERVRIQGKEQTELAHTTCFSVIESARGTTSLTYFEYSTLSALMLFKQKDLDVIILEVGLGGRLDATNIIDADVAILTSIALDHTDWLGSDRESIGREKAGIFRAGKPAIVGEIAMPASVAEVADNLGAVLSQRDCHWHYTQKKESWTFSDSYGKLEQLPLPQVPLPNAATALAALRASPLQIDETLIRNCLDKAVLPGRFQTVATAPRVILDVAHNPHAACYLASRLTALPRKGKTHAVIGILQNKDIAGILEGLKPQVDYWYCVSLDVPDGASATQLKQYLPKAQKFNNINDAWQTVLHQAKIQDIVLVCGSFHTVAKIMQIMKTENECGE